MTRNQLAYHSLQETIRTNMANEGIKRDQHQENARHNKSTERLTQDQTDIQRNLAKSQQFKNYVSGVSGAIKDVAGAVSNVMGIPSINMGSTSINGTVSAPMDAHASIQSQLNKLNFRDLRLGSLS